MNENIIKKINQLTTKYKTYSPYDLAERMGIILQRHDLGSILGYYYKAYRIQHIVLNTSLNDRMEKYVYAHELGHAILHPNANTPFLRGNTFLSITKMEKEANLFSMYLLLPSDTLNELLNSQYSPEMISTTYGYPLELIQLRINDEYNKCI